MKNYLGIVVCEDFIEEVKFIVKTDNIENILISTFASNHSNIKSKQNDYIMEAIKRCEGKCNKIIIIGSSSYVNPGRFAKNTEKYRIHKLEHDFDLFINKNIISNFIDEKLYLVTSGWLENWKQNINSLNFSKEYTKIRLLDTGLYEEGSLKKLQELAEYVNLPYDSIFVGLDFLRMFIEKIILEWKLEYEQKNNSLTQAISNLKKYEDLKRTEKLIEKEKKQLSYILNSIYESVFIMDSNYKILFVNKGIEKLLNLENYKEIIGKNLFDIGIIHDEYRETVLDRFKIVLENNVAVPLIEEKLIQCDGTTIIVDIYSGAIEYEDNLCILSVIRDISEHKKSENLRLEIQKQSELLDKAEEYAKLKTEFFANLSHEFRTPLNVMLSTLQLLNLIGANKSIVENEDKVKKYYIIMKQNCYRLLRLINNFIDITRIDAEYFKLNLKNENIISIIEDITLSVTDYAKNKGLNLIFDTDIEEKIIACDSDKIERIMLNLLSNAIKFTPFGGHILVSITDKKSSIIVSVKDTGTGIPFDKQVSIFKRFIQVDKSLSRNREGSGIGLSLVKSLVELHNGTIGLVSEYGNGSEFIIEFPVNILPKNDKMISADENLAKESNIDRINIEFSDIYD